MKICKIIEIIKGQILTEEDQIDQEIQGAMGADLMSDVLASIQPEAALLTGLCNPQVVRTALIADVRAIIFVRSKKPDAATIQLAAEENIPLIITPLGLFESCGLLFEAGLESFETESKNSCA